MGQKPIFLGFFSIFSRFFEVFQAFRSITIKLCIIWLAETVQYRSFTKKSRKFRIVIFSEMAPLPHLLTLWCKYPHLTHFSPQRLLLPIQLQQLRHEQPRHGRLLNSFPQPRRQHLLRVYLETGIMRCQA